MAKKGERKCPRCKKMFERWQAALSRRDQQTMLCSACGQAEGLEDINVIKKWSKKPYWKETA